MYATLITDSIHVDVITKGNQRLKPQQTVVRLPQRSPQNEGGEKPVQADGADIPHEPHALATPIRKRRRRDKIDGRTYR